MDKGLVTAAIVALATIGGGGRSDSDARWRRPLPPDLHARSVPAGPTRLGHVEPLGIVPQVHLVDLDDRVLDPFAMTPDDRATVVLFVSTDCPISNRYAPEVARLHERFAPRGVRFWLVYPNPAEGSAVIREHLRAYSYPMPALRDPQHHLVRAVGATVTPEAVVVDAARRLRYRGRIDDRYPALGIDRLVPTRRDLAEAIQAVLESRPVPTPITRAVGCLLADFAPP